MGLVDQIIQAESGGNPAAANPNSSASGLGQFTDATFRDVIRQARPDLAGLPDDQLMALKTDPTIGRQVTEAYAQQNQDALSKAGVPVTPGTTYLAHFAGPGGAIKVLQADPDTKVSDILGAGVIKANPFLESMTAQGLQAWAAKKMGASLPQPGQTNAPQAAPAPAAGPLPSSPIFAQGAPVAAAQLPQQPQPDQGGPGPMPQIDQPQAPQIMFAQPRPAGLAALQARFKTPIFARNG